MDKDNAIDFKYVDPKGSLGLLAAGYKGVIIWKNARLSAGLKNYADPEVVFDSKQIIPRKKGEKKDEK
ncbi:MAG: hypothetical protein C0592_04940 [Marinilabiliales bacterium]|nr:MAG: hypothetical protein C0592_04940 [Marinilabiliales bacterium]